jgi:succinate-acetate transporter protein
MSSNNQAAWANPAPAGLVSFALACVSFFGLLSGNVNHSAIPLLGCWLIGAFIVQIVVAVIELREGAILGGNVFLFFAAFFCFTGGLEFFVKAYFNTVGGQPIDTTIDGYAWAVLTSSLVLWTPAYLKKSTAVMGLLVVVTDVGICFVTLMDLKILAPSYGVVAAYALLIAGILGIYLAAAMQLQAAFGRAILPIPGPIIKDNPKAM